MPAPYSGVVRSSCLGVWFAELGVNGLPALDSSCDLDDSVVWTSIFRSERTVPCWGSLEVCQRPGELEMQRRKQHTLRFWRYIRILPDDVFETIFGKLFSVPRTFGFVFRDQWDKSFQTRKGCNKQKCFFFLIKNALVGLRFSQFCTPGSGLTKGLTKFASLSTSIRFPTEPLNRHGALLSGLPMAHGFGRGSQCSISLLRLE